MQTVVVALAVAIHARGRALVGRCAVLGLADGEYAGVQFEHGAGTGRLISLVVATRAFRIAL